MKAREQPLTSFYLTAIAKFSKWAEKHRFIIEDVLFFSFFFLFIILGACFRHKYNQGSHLELDWLQSLGIGVAVLQSLAFALQMSSYSMVLWAWRYQVHQGIFILHHIVSFPYLFLQICESFIATEKL